jgi:alpha-aminoadipic semialdehyde synthase
MAKTVSLPAAVSADLILEGKITERGVIMPTSKEIYMPVLKALTDAGLEFKEEQVKFAI